MLIFFLPALLVFPLLILSQWFMRVSDKPDVVVSTINTIIAAAALFLSTYLSYNAAQISSETALQAILGHYADDKSSLDQDLEKNSPGALRFDYSVDDLKLRPKVFALCTELIRIVDFMNYTNDQREFLWSLKLGTCRNAIKDASFDGQDYAAQSKTRTEIKRLVDY